MMRNTANWMSAALLMLQLAIGLQWQVAHAVVAQSEQQMNVLRCAASGCAHERVISTSHRLSRRRD
jgi:hypothetical protein